MVIQETDRLFVGHIMESFRRYVYGRAKHDDGCTCLTNPSTTRCTIDKSLFMKLSPDIIRNPKRDGYCSHDSISISQNKTTGGVGPLTPNMAPRSTDRQESRTGFSSTPSNSEASVTETMSADITMHDVCSPVFGQLDNVVEPGQPELPGAANPLKHSRGPEPSQYPERSQDLNSSKDFNSPMKPKPKRIASLMGRVWPNRKNTSNTTWGVCIELHGKKERAKEVGPTKSSVERLFIQLRDNDLITRNENKLNLALINFRIDAMILKFKHRKVELRHWQQSKHPNKRSRSLHPDQRKRARNDTALDEITREYFDLGLGDDLQLGDNKALRERLRRYINIGEFCSILNKELG
ncbi:uncharacterized protein FTOL_02465 [Fusarium torulosum]|uniref:Uncharacterized protein n=1 Tax=Fusarium torulosum TaxID=33205 RepID=A0AAE8SEP8_9HYPO|nr:uncharacterized protein FTOL_02465 [Fusarium torulosum]